MFNNNKKNTYQSVELLKVKNTMAKNEVPAKSPNAVRTGMAQLSGSNLFFQRK